MSNWYVYGKRTQALVNTKTHELMGPDKNFRALDANGSQVSRLNKAKIFSSKEEAQAFIDNHIPKAGVLLEVRKGK